MTLFAACKMVCVILGYKWLTLNRFDLVQPEKENCITLRDLKRCGSPSLFFDMIFDLRKYEHQLRRIDPLFREKDEISIMTEFGEIVTLEWVIIINVDKLELKYYE